MMCTCSAGCAQTKQTLVLTAVYSGTDAAVRFLAVPNMCASCTNEKSRTKQNKRGGNGMHNHKGLDECKVKDTSRNLI